MKPVISLVNILGLSLSLALVIILSVYCYTEFTTDYFHKNADRVYLFKNSENGTYSPGILRTVIEDNVPGIEESVLISDTWEVPTYQFEDKQPINSDLIFANKGFFNVFTYTALEGNLESALDIPMSVVISSSLAEKLFGREQALGKSVKLNNKYDLTVAAVFEGQHNSCISFNSITNIETREIVQPSDGEFTNWGWNNFQLYLMIDKKAEPAVVCSAIKSLIPENVQRRYTNASLMPLKEIYFSGDSAGIFLKGGDKNKVLILTVVAFLVLTIAIFNFINISASQKHEKLYQVEILKINGAKNRSIFLNSLAETSLFFFASTIIAHFLVLIIAPFIQKYTGINFNPDIIFTSGYFFVAIAVMLTLSILSGIIPSLQVFTYKSAVFRKLKIDSGANGTFSRGILVSLQFVITIVLIGFTVLVQKQVNFGSSNLGFNQDNIIGIKLTPQLSEKKDVLENSLVQLPAINKVTFTQYFPGKQMSSWGVGFQENGITKHVNFNTFSSNSGLFELMGLQLTKGRFYNDDITTDLHKVIVNEKFLEVYGIDDPIGSRFDMNDGYEVIGVVKDFHYKSLSIPINPLVIRNDKYSSVCLAKLETDNFNSLHRTVEEITKIADELSPSFPVEVSFFDSAIENMYRSELLFRRTFSLFSICAIMICCLGIFALSLSSCQTRTKEIGIRKVNGAKVSDILAMLNKDFVKWVAIAFVIATPVAWYATHKWLESFAYKTSLSWWIFGLAGILALGIALLTVSWQSWRAATSNPVEALRYE